MTTDAEDRSTWPRNGQYVRRAELLRLIEENGGPQGLDLRGAIFVGDGPSERPRENPIDLSREALAPLAEAYRQANAGAAPPWLDEDGGVNLRWAQLQGAGLWRAQLQGAVLEGAQLQGGVLFRPQLQHANLVGAQLQGAGLWYAQLQDANLVGAELQGASLWHAQLQGADLFHAQLRDADLLGAQLQGASLGHAQLQGVDMYDVKALESARWYGALLDHTRIKRESLGKTIGDEVEAHKSQEPKAYHRAKEAYLLLKNNFNQIGRYEEASWAYVKEQQMERMAFHWEWRSELGRLQSAWRQFFSSWRLLYRLRRLRSAGAAFWSELRGTAWGSFWRWLRNWAYELLTGYGERPWNAVGAGAAVILAFGVGFWASGIGGGRGALAFLDCLVYSIATFATFNLARPDLNPTGRGIEIASSLEAILGISVLALVVFTVGNRMSRS